MGLGVLFKVLDLFVFLIIVVVFVIIIFIIFYFIWLVNLFFEWFYKVFFFWICEFLDCYVFGKKIVNYDSDWKWLLKMIVGRVIIYSVFFIVIWLLFV